MGIKITELTSASTLVGNELTPLIQSTETRQTAVSSVFTALTSQNDERYVCGISVPSQGYLAFTGAGNCSSLDLGVHTCSNVNFAGLSAAGDTRVCGSLTVAGGGANYIHTNVPLSAYGGVDICSDLNVRGTTTLGGSVTLGGCTTMSNLPDGQDNSVVILDSDNILRKDEIDSKVWGGKLVAYCGTSVGNNKVPQFVGTDGTVANSIITSNTGEVRIGGDLVVEGCFSGSSSVFCSNVAILGAGCSLNVAGSIVGCANLTLACLPVSDPNIAGRIYYCPSDKIIRISAAT